MHIPSVLSATGSSPPRCTSFRASRVASALSSTGSIIQPHALRTTMLCDFSTCGTLRFPHRTDETEALAWQGFDEALFLAGIADRVSCHIQAGGQSRIGHDAPIPNGADEVVFTDDALPVADQIIEQVEHLWRDGDHVRPAV